MKTFEVIRKSDGVAITTYTSEGKVEWVGMEYAEYDHNDITFRNNHVEPTGVVDPCRTLIDIGPFFDRFGSAKMAILTSTDLVVQAILTDVSVRKWVDLALPEIVKAMYVLGMKIPSVTQDIKNNVLKTPVLPEENFALRKLYFS